MPKKSAKKTVKKAIAKKVMKKSSGRPKNSGRFGCETKAVRIPTHLQDEILAFIQKKLKAEAKKP